ncbi:MAG: hypothetical protein QOD75_106, partial [Blastocatellia bacterium]|nr:hypothetical protein [Blastocatellia bacterium]
MKPHKLVLSAAILIFTGLPVLGQLTADAVDSCNNPSFNSPPSFDAGGNPMGPATGDLNGDGLLDLAVANLSADTFSILFGDGAGAFLPPRTFGVGIKDVTVGAYPRAVGIGDINVDGKLDLVVVGGYANGWVSLLLGDGSGGFGPAFNQPTGNGALYAVTLGDFNGDGKKDFAVAGGSSLKISFLLGNGAGGVGSISRVTVTSEPTGIVSGDFNGDGLDDVVTMNTYSNWQLNVVLGRSDGNFVLNQSITTRSQTQALALADFNNDGKLDLAAGFAWADYGVEIRYGDGAGSFGPVANSVLTVYAPTSLLATDFNGDGKADFAVALSGANAMAVMLGAGNAQFYLPPHSYGTLPDAANGLVLGDFNQDGKKDIVASNYNAKAVAMLTGDGAGAFAAPTVIAIENERGGSITTGDFSGDGKPDLAVAGGYSSEALVYRNDGSGGVSLVSHFSVGSYAASIAKGDFNNDGTLDLVVGHDLYANYISVLLGSGLNFTLTNINISANSNVVLVGNFNADSNLDLAILGNNFSGTTNVGIMLGNGAGGFSAPVFVSVSARSVSIDSGDFNGDGKLDVAVGNGNPNTVTILLGDGAGGLSPAPYAPLPVPPLRQLRVAEINNDGLPDLLVTSSDASNVGVLLNNGAGFNTVKLVEGIPGATAVTAADFNNDGNPDLAVTTPSYPGNVAVLSGDGLGNFGTPYYFTAGATSTDITAVDFNGDGKLDLATPNYGAILLNTFKVLPCLTINDNSITETDFGSVSADFTVTLSAPSSVTVRVNYSLSSVTASSSADLTPVSGRLVFAPGETTKTIAVPITGDLLDEFDETFKLLLSKPANAGISDGEGIGTILDNDPIPTLKVNDISNVEGGPSFSRNFTFTLSAPSGRAVTVDYSTANGTATSGSQSTGDDYFNASGTLTIPAGQTTASVGVVVFGDSTYEPDETFFLNLSNATNATIEDAQGMATIINDDSVPTLFMPFGGLTEGNTGTQNLNLVVTLTNATYLPVVFNFTTRDDTATAGSDYTATSGTLTIDPGKTEGTIVVPIIGDVVDEMNESFFLDISNLQNATPQATSANISIFDDDGPTISINDISVKEGNSGNSIATFTLTLSATSPQSITVRAVSAPGTASTPSDYFSINSNVTILAGSLTRTFNMAVVGDTAVEPDETFFVNLTNPINGTIADGQGIGTILNDDASIQMEFATYNFSEGVGNAQVHVKRTGDTTVASSVNFSTGGNSFFSCDTINGSAVQNCDFTLNQGTLAFAAGQSDRSINILINDDTYVEGNETLPLTLSSPVGATLGSPSSATITLNDNDSAGATVPAPKTFIATLASSLEVPPTGTNGKGGGMVQLDGPETGGKAGLIFSSLSSAETAAHIHGAAPVGTNAPILFPLPLGTVTNFAISPTGQQVADLKAGLHYMNVHSNNFLNGEIRGQLLWNPLIEVDYFVTQHYYDFLGRLPDQSGFDFWTNEMKQCGINVQCFRDKSVDVSNAFFYEQEYQQTASYVFLLYRAAYGNTQPFPNPDPANPTEANKLPRYLTFVRDRAQVTGGSNLAASQKALADAFVQRAEFTSRYPLSLSTGAQFVDAILATISTADGAVFAAADR